MTEEEKRRVLELLDTEIAGQYARLEKARKRAQKSAAEAEREGVSAEDYYRPFWVLGKSHFIEGLERARDLIANEAVKEEMGASE